MSVTSAVGLFAACVLALTLHLMVAEWRDRRKSAKPDRSAAWVWGVEREPETVQLPLGLPEPATIRRGVGVFPYVQAHRLTFEETFTDEEQARLRELASNYDREWENGPLVED